LNKLSKKGGEHSSFPILVAGWGLGSEERRSREKQSITWQLTTLLKTDLVLLPVKIKNAIKRSHPGGR
jgi:hypothetical protein